jgi:hypothetical protein
MSISLVSGLGSGTPISAPEVHTCVLGFSPFMQFSPVPKCIPKVNDSTHFHHPSVHLRLFDLLTDPRSIYLSFHFHTASFLSIPKFPPMGICLMLCLTFSERLPILLNGTLPDNSTFFACCSSAANIQN